jgi:hypothetical protein
MSLKIFHVIFITFAVIMTVGFGVWCLAAPQAEGVSGRVPMGVAALVIGTALVVYEVGFLRKFKNTR